MRRNLKVCKLDYHFQKHVEGKDKDDRRPEKIKIRESIQWKEHQKVVCKKDYIEAAQKNIFYSAWQLPEALCLTALLLPLFP